MKDILDQIEKEDILRIKRLSVHAINIEKIVNVIPNKEIDIKNYSLLKASVNEFLTIAHDKDFHIREYDVNKYCVYIESVLCDEMQFVIYVDDSKVLQEVLEHNTRVLDTLIDEDEDPIHYTELSDDLIDNLISSGLEAMRKDINKVIIEKA